MSEFTADVLTDWIEQQVNKYDDRLSVRKIKVELLVEGEDGITYGIGSYEIKGIDIYEFVG